MNQPSHKVKPLEDRFLNLFLEQGELEDYPPETLLFRAGRPINDIYLIKRGLVKFLRADAQGKEILSELREPGRLLGAASVLSQNPAPVTAATLTACQIQRLSTAVFLQAFEADHELMRAVVRTISQQFYDLVIRYAQLGLAQARGRLAQILLHFLPQQAPGASGELRLQLPFKYDDLAKLLAVSPEWLSKLLRQLEEDGVLRRGNSRKREIFVPDLELLKWEAKQAE